MIRTAWLLGFIMPALSLSVAAGQERFLPRPPAGWNNPENWTGPGVTARAISGGVEIVWKDKSDIVFKPDAAMEFGKVANLGVVLEVPAADADAVWEPVGRSADDVCGQRVGVRKEPASHYWGYELLNARAGFKQITFRPAGESGRVRVMRMSFYERDQPLRYRKDRVPHITAGEGAEPESDGLTPLLTGVKAADGWPVRRAELAKLWAGLAGVAPAEAPESPVLGVMETADFPDYRRRKLRIDTGAGETVEAYLLVPASYREGGPAMPAVVCLGAAESGGSAEEAVGMAGRGGSAFALHLVKEGFVTLAFDAFPIRGDAKTRAAALAKHPKWSGLGKTAWEIGRAVDVLAGFPFTDKARIGVVGHGAGARAALAAAATDGRIACAVVSEAGIALGSGDWFAPELLGERHRGRLGDIEGHQLLALCAPRPVLVIGGDGNDGDRTKSYLEHAGRVWRLLGAADKVSLYNHRLGGGFPIQARSEAYQWLEQQLTPGK